MSYGTKRLPPLGRCTAYLVLTCLAVSFVFPFLWLVSSSFKESYAIFSPAFSLLPKDMDGNIRFILSNYVNAIQYLSITVLLKNTLIVAVINTVINLVFNSMAGYAFARLRFKGREIVFRIILLSMMIPGTVMLIPNLLIVNRLGIYDTLLALILPFTMSVYNIFLMRQHFTSLSGELCEAAQIDGAGQLRIFFQIAMPLASPMLVVLGITTFI